MKKITVVGSISTDFVVSANRRPEVGETIEGLDFGTEFGGKGANQAVVSSRLGAETHIIGAVGGDEFGASLIQNLEENGISVKNVKRVIQKPSGSAIITLSQQDNSIIYVPGANAEVAPDDIREAKGLIKTSDLVLVQNETADETVRELIGLCAELEVPLLLNPAPARALDRIYIEDITYLTPNEIEFKALFSDYTMEEALVQYPNKLLITLGEEGAVFHNGEKIVKVPAFQVDNIVDTTGAGDTFNGAFAVAISAGLSMEASVRFGNLAASMSIQKEGAQNGVPTLAELKEAVEYERAWDFE